MKDFTVENVLAALGEYTKTGSGYKARCPAHNDSSPSLSISEGDNGKAVVCCHAGCTQDAVMAKLGYSAREANASRASKPNKDKPRNRHATAEAAIKAAKWGVEQNDKREIVETIPHLYENGQPFGYSVRFNFADGKTYRQVHRDGDAWLTSAGDNLWPIFKLNELPAEGVIYLHEGEKACLAGWQVGLPSTCCKGGCKAPQKTDWQTLAGREICILPDRDEPGEKFTTTMVGILQALGSTVKVVRLKGRPEGGGDLADIVESGKKPEDVRDSVITSHTLAKVEPQPKPEQPKETGPTLRLTSMADIEAREVEWLWKNRITIGSLTLLTGPQGMTKSFLTVDLAARVSLGSPHPDASGVCPQGRVIFFTMEDAPNEAIKPRLEACGANHAEVFYANGMVEKPEDETDHARMIRLNTELAELERAITQLGNVKLVIFDPLSEYLGKGDRNSDADVRGVLTPLSDMARRLGIAIVAVHHINKRSKEVSAVQTVGGAGAWTQVPRTVLHVVNDPDDENITFTRRRLMVCTKSNYGGTNEGQTYRLTDGKHPAVEWLPEIIKIDAEQVVRSSRQQEDGRHKTQRREAAASDLYELIQRGPLESNDIDHYMTKKGHSERQIRAARKELGLIKLPRDRNTDPWKWTLPENKTGGLAEGQTGTCTIDEWMLT